MSRVELREFSDRWEIPLDGCAVTRCCIDHAVTFTIADAGPAFEIRIEEPFEIHRAGDDARVEPGGDPLAVAPALALLHAQVQKAVAFRDGRLRLLFLDGGEVLISASEAFEPWTLVGPGGLRLVSMPGGDVALWRPEASYAITIDGHTSIQATADDSPVEATIGRAVRMIDGDRHCAVSLWALPPGTPIDLVKPDEWPQEYIQAAGEDRRRLTAEVRRRGEAGGYEQFVIGRPEATSETPTETISWSGGNSTVAASEVLTADDVVDLFVAYYRTGTVPRAFSRRQLPP